jgi:hypothetical protein
MNLENLHNIGFCLSPGASRMSWQTSDCEAAVVTYTSRVECLGKYEVHRVSFRKCIESRLTFLSIHSIHIQHRADFQFAKCCKILVPVLWVCQRWRNGVLDPRHLS